MSLNRLLTGTFKAAFSTHIMLSGSSMAYGAFASGSSPIEDTDANEISSPAAAFVLDAVTEMYSGRGVSNHKGFAKHVVFEDPAAKCVGIHEVSEAFRALQWCSPQSLREPRIVANAATLDRGGWGSMMVLELNQSYFDHKLRVKSYVIVEVDEKGLIKRMEERWNGASLLSWKPFKVSRRLNGLVSYALTTIVFRGKK